MRTALYTVVLLSIASFALAQRRRPAQPRPTAARPAPTAAPAPAPTGSATPAIPAPPPPTSAASAAPPSPYGEAPAAEPQTPAPPPMPPAGAAASSTGAPVEALRGEYHQILDEIFQARSRLEAVGAALYDTRLVVLVINNAPERVVPQKLVVRLDGGNVFSSDRPVRGENGQRTYDGFAAPGPHSIGVEVVHQARGNARYRYAQNQTFYFEALNGHRTTLTVIVDDDSEIAEDFASDHEGEYDLRMRLRVVAEPLPRRSTPAPGPR